jgi:hypothetical protein
MTFFGNPYMDALMPENSSLESIGSVAANFSRSSEKEECLQHVHFYYRSFLAEMIADDIADMQARAEAKCEYEAKRLARKVAREAAVKRCRDQLKALVVKGVKKIVKY